MSGRAEAPGAGPAPRVTTLLESLAAQRASGALEVDGDPASPAEPGDAPVIFPAPGAPEPLPRRRPGTHLASELSAAQDEVQPETAAPCPAPPVPGSYTPPPLDVLHRLLDGLRNLT